MQFPHIIPMIPINGNPLYTGHLKGNQELYLKNNSLVIIHEKKGNVFNMELQHIRCAIPISHNTVRIFWRAPKNVHKNGPWKYWNRYQYDLKLDFKKSFPEKKIRRTAEKTESKRLANIILNTIQKSHSINQPNTKGYLAMHTGEYLMDSYEGQCKFGKGIMLLTNLGIYFTTEKGLCLDMPLDVLDSYNYKNKTVIIHYFEPMWTDGYDTSSKKNRKIEIRVESAQSVCNGITKAYSVGGAKEIRALAKYTDNYSSISPSQHYAEFFSGKYGEFKEYNDYLAILAKRRWGIPTTKEVADNDAEVVLACLCTNTPIDIAGEMTQRDKKFRADTTQYNKEYEKYSTQYTPLLADIITIITKNLSDADTQKIKTKCNPNILFDTIAELAENGSIPDSFKPKSLTEWLQFKENTNKKIIKQNLRGFPNGLSYQYIDEIFCPWSVQDARRIISEPDYTAIIDSITTLKEQYTIEPYLDGVMYAKTFEGEQREEIKLRVRRIYDEWCKTHPLSEWTDPTDRRWVQDTINNLNEENLEKRRSHYSEEKTLIDEIRDIEMESQNVKIRLERAVKPKGIPDKDIYIDAWYDRTKNMWFTTNQYFRIPELSLEIMSPDVCEQKWGYKAHVFSNDIISFRHGYPAIYNKEKKWWVLLCTISDDKMTKEMIQDKRINHTLRFETEEADLVITNSGTLGYATERELFLYTKDDNEIWGRPLPLNERIRRLIFTELAAYCVAITPDDKLQRLPILSH